MTFSEETKYCSIITQKFLIMKTLKRIAVLLVAGALGVCFTACNEKEALTPSVDQEYVTVNLGVSGEYVKFSETPMATRAGADTTDIIGIAVYTVNNGLEAQYAYGIFNSLENVSIKLLAGQKYRFVASIKVDGNHCTEHNYNCPSHDKLSERNVGTDFKYTSGDDIYNFFEMYYSSDGVFGPLYKHDRFYGELTDYVPENSGTVEIETKRVAYGVHYIVEGLTEGYLKVDVSCNGNKYYSVEIPAENPETDAIYSFKMLRDAWRGIHNWETDSYEEYYRNKVLVISWIKADGSSTPLGSYDVTFKRNVRTTVKINVEDASLPNGIRVVRMDNALSGDDKEYVITGGQVIKVPVTE